MEEKSNSVRSLCGHLKGNVPHTWSEFCLGDDNNITIKIGGSERRGDLSPTSLFGV